ncbi:trehalose-phosphatase [Nitratireductor thuwali]|uniref:Trehalose 6-phosphate phosphatase n=1 Tax=Nitratireductor thuwali TaxID=2267699 RepID=A0ABY5MFU8_9HYPH|nr:Trehalose-6-phosphate phosphatase [Nitratireductor thuwali]
MAGTPEPLTSLDRSRLRPDRIGIFLDFDGTLAEIAEHPEAVSVPQATREVLGRLARSLNGAVAIVTGRPISEIDRFLRPLNLPVAGIHGLERRGAGGERSAATIDTSRLDEIEASLKRFQNEHEGIVIERKSASVALHYRQRPELAEAAMTWAHEAVDGSQGLQILQGKMVIEIKAGKENKADAVTAFMTEEPFAGRLALFAGDDVTDEDAFNEVARRGGISIKIGGGETAAAFRIDGVGAFRQWLSQLADDFETPQLTE